MGYYSRVEDLNIDIIDLSHLSDARFATFIKSISVADKRWSDTPRSTLEYFMSMEIDEDGKFIQFTDDQESGKAYTLMEHLTLFVEQVAKFGDGETMNGVFYLYGENKTDMQRITIKDNVITVQKAVITYE